MVLQTEKWSISSLLESFLPLLGDRISEHFKAFISQFMKFFLSCGRRPHFLKESSTGSPANFGLAAIGHSIYLQYPSV
jgi:hypothetical protein